MVITVLLLGKLWRVWRKREDERRQIAALTGRELQDMGLSDADRQALLDATLLRSLPGHYRRLTAEMRTRRARTQRAVSRLSRMRAARDDACPRSSAA